VVAPTRLPWGGRLLGNGWAGPKEHAGGRSLARRSTRLGDRQVEIYPGLIFPTSMI